MKESRVYDNSRVDKKQRNSTICFTKLSFYSILKGIYKMGIIYYCQNTSNFCLRFVVRRCDTGTVYVGLYVCICFLPCLLLFLFNESLLIDYYKDQTSKYFRIRFKQFSSYSHSFSLLLFYVYKTVNMKKNTIFMYVVLTFIPIFFLLRKYYQHNILILQSKAM